ncbi:MAG: LUD domain-containing protein [Flavobacteriaceae bacterium]
MNFFKRLFNSNQDKTEKETPQEQNLGSLSLEESFVHQFVSKGGKFLYCSNTEELDKQFLNIAKENNWTDFEYYKSNPLEDSHIQSSLPIESKQGSAVFISACEYLISNDGTILLSSNQIGEQKIINLPENFILIARTSQIVKDKRDALHGINWGSQTVKPTNISTIKYFDLNIKSDDILKNYGNSNSKNLYLLLLEDL